MKNLVLFFTIKEFEKVHLYKDVGLVPYYLCKEYNLNGKIVYSNKVKKELTVEVGFTITPLPNNDYDYEFVPESLQKKALVTCTTIAVLAILVFASYTCVPQALMAIGMIVNRIAYASEVDS